MCDAWFWGAVWLFIASDVTRPLVIRRKSSFTAVSSLRPRVIRRKSFFTAFGTVLLVGARVDMQSTPEVGKALMTSPKNFVFLTPRPLPGGVGLPGYRTSYSGELMPIDTYP